MRHFFLKYSIRFQIWTTLMATYYTINLVPFKTCFARYSVMKVIAGKFYKRCQLIGLHDKNTYFYLFCYNFAPHVEFWLKLKNGPSPNQNYFIFASIQIIVINRSCHQPTQEIMARQFIINPNYACYLQEIDPLFQYL